MGLDIMSIIIVLVFILDIFNGYRRGFVKVLIDFFGVIVGIFAAFTFYRPVGFFMANFFPNMALALQNVVGFIIVFVITMALLQLIGYVLSLVMKLPGLSTLNRIAGAAFSFLKTWIVLGLLFMIVFSMGFIEVNRAISDSSLGSKLVNAGNGIYKSIEGILPKADDLIPDDWNFDFFKSDSQPQNLNSL